MWHHKTPDQKYRFNCTQCPYSTNKKTNFDSHAAVHDPRRSQWCKYCGNGFNCISSLNKHLLIHTGEDHPTFYASMF